MNFNYNEIEFSKLENFKGGEKYINAHMFFDGKVRIIRASLVPGASIGLHTHETNSEILYIISGCGTAILDGEKFKVSANSSHYCPKGSSHSLINDSNEDLHFFSVVPEQ